MCPPLGGASFVQYHVNFFLKGCNNFSWPARRAAPPALYLLMAIEKRARTAHPPTSLATPYWNLTPFCPSRRCRRVAATQSAWKFDHGNEERRKRAFQAVFTAFGPVSFTFVQTVFRASIKKGLQRRGGLQEVICLIAARRAFSRVTCEFLYPFFIFLCCTRKFFTFKLAFGTNLCAFVRTTTNFVTFNRQHCRTYRFVTISR